jgi:hypothetical protein
LNPENHDHVQETSEKPNRERANQAAIIFDFEKEKGLMSQRQFAEETGMSQSTLQHWIARKNSIDASPVFIEFFESPEGQAFLHRLTTSAHLEFTKNGTASIHNVSRFLHLSGLSPFIASSYPTQRRVSKQMDEKIVLFGNSENRRLGKEMTFKIISLCEDETFHPKICLVAMDPQSNFIILEKYAENRESETWNEAVKNALKHFSVKILQVAGDEGRSLVCHARKGLKVHHSSDCFHVIYEVGRGTSGALAAKIRKLEKEHEMAAKQTAKASELKEKYDNAAKRPRGRRPDFEKRIQEAEKKEEQAEESLKKARENQETVRNAKAEIGQVYHPYNLDTGQMQDDRKVSELLEKCFDEIKAGARELSDRCKARVEKAHRVVKNMVATVAFFFQTIDLYMENMGLSARDKELMHNYLIPAYYLMQAANKERNPDRKSEILKKAEEILAIVDSDGDCVRLTDMEISRLKQAAEECAQYFQRSSSCVEGRNAQLALRHRGIHRLSDLHLNALTVVHNYYIRRRDGTTAAERFFQAKHRDLFEFLLENMDYPSRPRKHARMAA